MVRPVTDAHAANPWGVWLGGELPLLLLLLLGCCCHRLAPAGAALEDAAHAGVPRMLLLHAAGTRREPWTPTVALCGSHSSSPLQRPCNLLNPCNIPAAPLQHPSCGHCYRWISHFTHPCSTHATSLLPPAVPPLQGRRSGGEHRGGHCGAGEGDHGWVRWVGGWVECWRVDSTRWVGGWGWGWVDGEGLQVCCGGRSCGAQPALVSLECRQQPGRLCGCGRPHSTFI